MESPNARVCANNPGKPAGNTVLVVHECTCWAGMGQGWGWGGKDVTILSVVLRLGPIKVPLASGAMPTMIWWWTGPRISETQCQGLAVGNSIFKEALMLLPVLVWYSMFLWLDSDFVPL